MDNISEEDLPRMTRAGRTAVRKMPARTKEESVQQLASIRISTPNPKVKHEGVSLPFLRAASNQSPTCCDRSSINVVFAIM